jgi:hypothetical protein
MHGKFSVRHSSDLTRPNSVSVDHFDTIGEADEHARRISHNRYASVWHDAVGFLGTFGSEKLLTMGNRKKLPND